MQWYIITGEFPPQRGGVSDYTYQLAQILTAGNDEVHILAPACGEDDAAMRGVSVHRLPRGFGFRWLRALSRALPSPGAGETILVQYVPHGYGWKAMNLAFCLWILRQKRRRLFVMFHEVAYPFRRDQPLKHNFLAAVQRVMAWLTLGSAEKCFTSSEPYRDLLRRLRPGIAVDLLRICSNVPFERRRLRARRLGEVRTVGIFSNFSQEICAVLEPVVPMILAQKTVRLLLIGPGEAFLDAVGAKFPEVAEQISTTSFVRALDVGCHLQSCDALLQIYPDGAAAARGTLTAAIASGVPVVTNYGLQTEPIFRASGAVALAESNPTAIARVLERVLSDESVTRRLELAGRKLYEEQFDIAVTAAKLRQAVSGAQVPVTTLAPVHVSASSMEREPG